MDARQGLRDRMQVVPRVEIAVFGIALCLVIALTAWAVTPGVTGGAASVNAGGGSASDDAPAFGAEDTLAADAAGSAADAVAGGTPGLSSNGRSGGQAPGDKTAAPQVRRTASDRGVTPDTIKIGVTRLDLNAVTRAGFAPYLREDDEQAIKAFIDAINQAGGINGRRLVPVIAKVDPLNTGDQRAKCIHLTEVEKVFAVIDVDAYIDEAGQSCFTVEHQTPYIHSAALGANFMRKGFPFDVTVQPDFNRILVNTILGARDAGFFEGSAKVGLLTDDSAASALDDRDRGVRALLHQVGVPDSRISEFRLSADATQAQSQTAQAVLQHKAANVTKVLPLTVYISVQTYLSNADAQSFRPQYWSTDFQGLSYDVVTTQFSPTQWDRTRAVTTTKNGELAAGRPLSDPAKACSKVLTDHGMPPVTGYTGDSVILAYCDLINLFVAAMRNAGTNPTRVDWGKAVASVGELPVALYDRAIYDRPGKVSGGDSIALIEWRKECKCWVQLQPHGRSRG